MLFNYFIIFFFFCLNSYSNIFFDEKLTKYNDRNLIENQSIDLSNFSIKIINDTKEMENKSNFQLYEPIAIEPFQKIIIPITNIEDINSINFYDDDCLSDYINKSSCKVNINIDNLKIEEFDLTNQSNFLNKFFSSSFFRKTLSVSNYIANFSFLPTMSMDRKIENRINTYKYSKKFTNIRSAQIILIENLFTIPHYIQLRFFEKNLTGYITFDNFDYAKSGKYLLILPKDLNIKEFILYSDLEYKDKFTFKFLNNTFYENLSHIEFSDNFLTTGNKNFFDDSYLGTEFQYLLSYYLPEINDNEFQEILLSKKNDDLFSISAKRGTFYLEKYNKSVSKRYFDNNEDSMDKFNSLKAESIFVDLKSLRIFIPSQSYLKIEPLKKDMFLHLISDQNLFDLNEFNVVDRNTIKLKKNESYQKIFFDKTLSEIYDFIDIKGYAINDQNEFDKINHDDFKISFLEINEFCKIHEKYVFKCTLQNDYKSMINNASIFITPEKECKIKNEILYKNKPLRNNQINLFEIENLENIEFFSKSKCKLNFYLGTLSKNEDFDKNIQKDIQFIENFLLKNYKYDYQNIDETFHIKNYNFDNIFFKYFLRGYSAYYFY